MSAADNRQDSLPVVTSCCDHWKRAATGLIGNVIVVSLYYAVTTPDRWVEAIPQAMMWGFILGGITTLFVVVATLPLMKSMQRRKVAAILLAALAPPVGWTIVGVVTGISGDWLLFIAYPVVGVSSGIGAAIVAGVVSLFVPSLETDDDRTSESGGQALRDLLSDG